MGMVIRRPEPGNSPAPGVPGNKTGESSFSCVWFSMREIRMMVQKSGELTS